MEEKKNEEGKGGKYFWRSKVCGQWGRRKTEEEKEENIWRRRIFCQLRRRKIEKERQK